MTDNRKKGKRGSFLRTVVLIAALAVFCYSAYQLVTIYLAYKQGTDEYSDLEQYADLGTADGEDPAVSGDGAGSQGTDGQQASDGTEAGESVAVPVDGTDDEGDFVYETETDKETGETRQIKLYYMRNPVDFDGLLAINEDIIAWLRVGALDLSYPVTQAEDNDYYLHRTFRREDNFAGCIFLDYLNEPDFSDQNSIIYGHNMKNGSMFGTLSHFAQDGVYESAPYFWIYTADRIYKYEIFSCSTVGVNSETYTLTFATKEDFRDYLYSAMEQSVVDNSSVTIDENDRIVTLSTCTGTDTTRYVVQGKLVQTYIAR